VHERIGRAKGLQLFEDLVSWLAIYLADAGCRVLRAGSIREAEAWVAEHDVDAAFIDQILPDGDGVPFAVRLSSRTPPVVSVIMTGGLMSAESQAVCDQFALPVLTKPFPGPQRLTFIDNREPARTQSAS
jgi:DNA-binding NtrC family response regulator